VRWIARQPMSRGGSAFQRSLESRRLRTLAGLESFNLHFFKSFDFGFFLFLFLFPQASSSSTLRFYATNRYVVDESHHIRSPDRLFAYEKFGVLFNSPRPWPPGKVTGLPARVRRDFTSAIGIRKAGQVSTLYIVSLWDEKKGEYLFLWEGRCEDCVCASMTLKCNTQCASRLVTSVIERWVQFDSDYSVEDDASPSFFSGKLSSDLC